MDEDRNGSDIEVAEEKIAEIERSLDETRDQLLRRTAEMENMRRRHHAEREQLIFEGNKRLLLDLLPIVDDLERTLLHAENAYYLPHVDFSGTVCRTNLPSSRGRR